MAFIIGELLIPLIIILVIATKSQNGSKSNAIGIVAVTIFFVLAYWPAGMTAVIGVLIIGLVGVISIYTKQELPKKDKEKENK